MTRTLRLGTRRSPLALAQSRLVAAAVVLAGGPEVELVEITTSGDLSTAALVQIGGTGVFVSALRDALLAGEVDLAVHSLKDLPVGPAEGLVLAAVPAREDPRDVLVARDGLTLAGLPPGSSVGTGSPRRAAQLLDHRPDLDVRDLRGNVGTRLAHVAEGRLDAVVLAAAGLSRLGLSGSATEVLDPSVVLPAPGQGALAIECRADRADVLALLAPLDDAPTRTAVTAERALLAALEAGCSAPVGALAETGAGAGAYAAGLTLWAAVADPGGPVRRMSATGHTIDPEGLGRALAAQLLPTALRGTEAEQAPMGVRTQ